MNKKSSLARSASAVDWISARDHTSALIQSSCPSCGRKMPSFHRYRLDKRRILACNCGYRRCVSEDAYQRLTGKCFVCGKKGCTGYDHRFHGELIGMGF